MSLLNSVAPRGNITRKKPRIFHGWWIVTAAVLLNLLQGGILFYGFTLVLDPMTDETGWTKTQVTGAYPIMGVVIGVLAPFVGSLFDRVGPRPLIAVGMSVMGLGLIMLHSVDSLLMFYVWFSLANVGSAGMWLSVGPTVANWFVRRRGRALGIYSLGYALAGITAPPFLGLIDGFDLVGFQFDGVGWRDSFLIVGIMFIILMPLAVLILQHRPENRGLYPDGADEPPVEVGTASVTSASDEAEVNSTAREALRTQAFWLLAAGSAMTFLTIATLQVHWVPYLGSAGFSREMAAFYLTFLPLSTVVGRLGFGFLADLWAKKRVTALAFTFQAAAILMLATVDASKTWTILAFLGLWGIGFGGMIVARMALQGYLFGRNSFGALQGMLSMTSEAGFAFSPVIASIVFESLGTYRPVFIVFAALSLLAAPLTLMIRRPGLAARGFGPDPKPTAKESPSPDVPAGVTTRDDT